MSVTTRAFALPDHLAAKAVPDLVARDEQHFDVLATTLEETVADLADRLAARGAPRRPRPAGARPRPRGPPADRAAARLRRFGLDLCLGRMVGMDDAEPVYVGRLGLPDARDAGCCSTAHARSRALLRATHANPMGLAGAGATAGRAGGSPTTGTRCSPRTA